MYETVFLCMVQNVDTSTVNKRMNAIQYDFEFEHLNITV